MIKISQNGLKGFVYYYGSKEGIITPKTWEKIICKSLGGIHIPGDKYMADGHESRSGLNIKTLKKIFTKGNVQTCVFVQCRCPLLNETIFIGEGSIKTLVDKREESFKDFNLDTMLDVLVLHNRIGEYYNVKVFIEEQPKYEDLNIEWYGNCGYINPDKSKKDWKSKWKLKRNHGNNDGWQTCLLVKKVVDYRNSVADFTIKSVDDYDMSLEEAEKIYSKLK